MIAQFTKTSFSEKTKYAMMEKCYLMLGINMENKLESVYRVEDTTRKHVAWMTDFVCSDIILLLQSI